MKAPLSKKSRMTLQEILNEVRQLLNQRPILQDNRMGRATIYYRDLEAHKEALEEVLAP